ncbi:hypothetical protein BDBG_07395 [Blastomyces gilchristii SLH14081]|uniref:Uncharacterized protein n=1 Tax=Blastomyces gilchristii (strain SLH14081) TaxID=559298 RepID=A0A179UV35_BLAGS|nr:uncharacterized protein BDBG_07395 [Blastomyces gilchristii SLH14081]OAT11986.1 hypothetical protein BDBG_07395 [Blastomyces gilchristii SLH14081]
MAAREAGEDVTMRAVLLQLIDITAFNLAFLTVTEAAAAPQRHLLTRKHQNKPLIISQVWFGRTYDRRIITRPLPN